MVVFDPAQVDLIAAKTLGAPHMSHAPRPIDHAMLVEAMKKLEAA
jgi:hypothetical protein